MKATMPQKRRPKTRLKPLAILTPVQIRIVRAVADPRYSGTKQIADALGMPDSYLKSYLGLIYRRLGARAGSLRLLALYGVAQREMLGIEVPTVEQFSKV